MSTPSSYASRRPGRPRGRCPGRARSGCGSRRERPRTGCRAGSPPRRRAPGSRRRPPCRGRRRRARRRPRPAAAGRRPGCRTTGSMPRCRQQLDEVEPLGLPAPGLQVHDQHRVLRPVARLLGGRWLGVGRDRAQRGRSDRQRRERQPDHEHDDALAGEDDHDEEHQQRERTRRPRRRPAGIPRRDSDVPGGDHRDPSETTLASSTSQRRERRHREEDQGGKQSHQRNRRCGPARPCWACRPRRSWSRLRPLTPAKPRPSAAAYSATASSSVGKKCAGSIVRSARSARSSPAPGPSSRRRRATHRAR